MNAIKLTDKVYWVGAIDWKIRDFHGYTTDKGTTYNAYLILADKVTLVDTVKAPPSVRTAGAANRSNI